MAEATNLVSFAQHAVRLDPVTSGSCVDNCLRVASITLTSKDVGSDSTKVTGRVAVRDENGVPVAGALVEVIWTTPFGMPTGAATTNDAGVAVMSMSAIHGEFRLTVTGVGKNFYTFDPAGSTVLTATIDA